jgi:hypothetical protein
VPLLRAKTSASPSCVRLNEAQLSKIVALGRIDPGSDLLLQRSVGRVSAHHQSRVCSRLNSTVRVRLEAAVDADQVTVSDCAVMVAVCRGPDLANVIVGPNLTLLD